MIINIFSSTCTLTKITKIKSLSYNCYLQLTASHRYFCDDSAASSNDKKKVLAKEKMKNLLKSLANKPVNSKQPVKELKLAIPSAPKVVKIEKVEKDMFMNVKVQQAVKNVAKEMDGDSKKIEFDLLNSFKSHSTKKSLSELLGDIKIDSTDDRTQNVDFKRNHTQKEMANFPKSTLSHYRKEFTGRASSIKPIDISLSSPLNIFPKNYEAVGLENNLETWDILKERIHKLALNDQPRNGFEEMIQWTEEGKLWTFPIDNEYGLDEEKQYHFSDHIFLEKHLAGWCPSKGPLRHFMELVCVGLSKNPYLTVHRKKAHIEWYNNYFNNKKKLLEHVGAM